MQSREGWTRAEPGPKVVKGKTYKTLVEYVRGCSVCAKPFSIFVTAKIASGHSDSNSFGLRNCEEHRRSRMHADATELSKLRTANATMADELPGLYERVRVQFEEIQVLKARLAVYELGPAMAASQPPDYDAFDASTAKDESPFVQQVGRAPRIGCEPVQNTTNGALPSKLPWE